MELTRNNARLSWNAGAWFGAQLGGTAWMFGLGVLLIPEAPWLATALLLCAGFSNAIGFALWFRRQRLHPYSALQWLVLTIGLATLFSIVYADLSGTIPLLDERLQDSPRSIYWILLIFPFLMVLFHFRYRPIADQGAAPNAAPPHP